MSIINKKLVRENIKVTPVTEKLMTNCVAMGYLIMWDVTRVFNGDTRHLTRRVLSMKANDNRIMVAVHKICIRNC